MIWCKERVGVKEESYRAGKRWLGRPGAYLHSPKDCSYLSSLFAAFFSGYSHTHTHAHTHTRTQAHTHNFAKTSLKEKPFHPSPSLSFSLSLSLSHTHTHSLCETRTHAKIYFLKRRLYYVDILEMVHFNTLISPYISPLFWPEKRQNFGHFIPYFSSLLNMNVGPMYCETYHFNDQNFFVT